MLQFFLIMLVKFGCVFSLLFIKILFLLSFLSLYLSRYGFLFITFQVIGLPMFLRFIWCVLKLIETLKNLTLSVSFLLFLLRLLPFLLLIILPFLYLSLLQILSVTHIIINPRKSGPLTKDWNGYSCVIIGNKLYNIYCMAQKYQLAGKKTNYKQKFFKGMTLQQYIRGVNEFYQTIEDNRDCSRSNEKVEGGRKPRTKTELEEYPPFVFRPDNPSPINRSPLNKSVKLSTNRTIDPSSSLRLSKLAFPKLKMQNEGIKLEHIDPIHSKLHIIRPKKQQENAKNLSKDYKSKKKNYHHHSKAKEMPVPLNLKHQIKKCFIHLNSVKASRKVPPIYLMTKATTIE